VPLAARAPFADLLCRAREPLLRLGILGKDALQLLGEGLGTNADLVGVAALFIVFEQAALVMRPERIEGEAHLAFR